MLDDGSADETEAICREYERRDPRVRYVRHPQREGMVATWREVAEIGFEAYPRAEFFAWASDHDRWHPDWLARLTAALDARPDAVLAYPYSPRIDDRGEPAPKEPREFSTDGRDGPFERWSHFCREGVGSGDMVYGLMRVPAFRASGVFRPVLRPDRLLVAEMTLHGHIVQVPEPLWFRRQAGVASIVRQSRTLFAGRPPRWFWLPPWLQHSLMILREYRRPDAAMCIPLARLLRILALYQLTYGWRHVRKTDTSHAIGRGVSNVVWSWKVVKKAYHHAVYYTLVEGRRLWGLARRHTRRAVYETLMAAHALRGRLRRARRAIVHEALVLTHRLGLRGR
jgi:glycosyltransferase involved in cell wall biosynthesis